MATKKLRTNNYKIYLSTIEEYIFALAKYFFAFENYYILCTHGICASRNPSVHRQINLYTEKIMYTLRIFAILRTRSIEQC